MERLLIALALFASAACGSSEVRHEVTPQTRAAFADLLIADEDCRQAGPAALTHDHMLSDVAVLERVMRRGYAGFELAGDEATWTDVFSAMRQGLPPEPATPLELRDHLIANLRFANDNHLGLTTLSAEGERSWRSTGGHAKAYYAELALTKQVGGYFDDAGATLLRCGDELADEIVRPVATDSPPAVAHAIVILSTSRLAEVECVFADAAGDESVRTVPLTRVDIDSSTGPAYERLEADFPWLRLRSLAVSYRGALDRFVATGPEVRTAPVVVLDVRGQGGGSDRFLLRWFKELTSESLPYFRTRTLESEATLQGALNFWGCIARNSNRADDGGRDWLSRRVAKARREIDEAMTERGAFRDLVVEQDIITGRAPEPFAGRLLLVTDAGCASACETSVLVARHFPGTLIVGENTNGTMKVGELRSYRLPRSSIYVNAGHRVHEDPSRSDIFPEVIGYEPDVWLVGDDADAQIRRLARCLSDAECARTLDDALD